tara:strand:+ start:1577 stop:2107 length:531 start_codon:yes stop_codon:yes gene_type:complete
MVRDALTQEVEFDYYLSLANLYDTTNLDVSWDWKSEHQTNNKMQSTQRIGAIAESQFISSCLIRSFEPHQPTTPRSWDFIVDCPKGLLKVQVKSTSKTTAGAKSETSYKISACTGSKVKKPIGKEIDVIACYIQQEDVWFLIPQADKVGVTIRLYTEQSSKSKYQKYRENWSIFYE